MKLCFSVWEVILDKNRNKNKNYTLSRTKHGIILPINQRVQNWILKALNCPGTKHCLPYSEDKRRQLYFYPFIKPLSAIEKEVLVSANPLSGKNIMVVDWAKSDRHLSLFQKNSEMSLITPVWFTNTGKKHKEDGKVFFAVSRGSNPTLLPSVHHLCWWGSLH